ncbi:N-carbamoyl-L-amino acid amidohydrolase [Pseudomonas brassicacearum]|uniref:N-carbamoyl-L-amino acid amidohydrolase n=2 Tax=Pseudomonas brassicacearum TaxID=930166 RepID=A0A423IID1_9PSED|nr:N-carbamoyl-L-amino acid amidohydrolase [Pseudomonas brassicacearum]
MTKNNSPYLSENNRLGDVIAAIQVMAVYKFYKLPFSDWADRINADTSQAEKWKTIFMEHPEFFRLDSNREKASLVWRRQFPKRYDVDAEKALSFEAFSALTEQQKERISRTPLTPSDIKALIDTAVNLHSRALEHQKDKRWWTVLASAIGGLIGAVAGALLK